jgi:hemoglobin/transferrin/lactoferrin receptor protein
MLAMSMVWGLTPSSAAAPFAEPDPATTTLNEITVSSTRTSRRSDNVPDTVTVTRADQIEQQGARDIKGLFERELDVSVSQLPNRYAFSGAAPSARGGNDSINIRGLDGNRVLIMVDGIRVPDSFRFGPFATGRGAYLQLDGISKVEVLRGPASTQFGSDGLAGAVSFDTLDPRDLLKDQQTRAGFARSAYAQADQSWTQTLATATRGERWSTLLLASLRRGHQVANQGANDAQNASRTLPNPQADRSRYLLAKSQVVLAGGQRLGWTLESLHHTQDTEIYSLRSASVLDARAHDRTRRQRLSLEHRLQAPEAPWLQHLHTRVYLQDAEVTQASDELRGNSAWRARDNQYRRREFGLSSQGQSHFSASAPQRLSYGLEWSRAEISALRQGTATPGEAFPHKPFPDTVYTLSGLYAQDEIEIGSFSLIPGLRFDQYALSPAASAYAGVPVALSGQALTPRLGLVWRWREEFRPYAQWAQGYRAPTADQVNNYFANPAHGYTSIGNANLHAERADSIEFGARGKITAFRYAFSVYDNHYRDFINQEIVGGSGTPANPLVFQYVNLQQARIRGWDARGEWQWSPRWSLALGVASARGDSTRHGVSTPLDSVMPLRVALTLRFEQQAWGVRADLQHAAAKARDRAAPIQEKHRLLTPFISPAYSVLDLGGYWRWRRDLRLGANLNNVFNRKYWRWSDVRGLADNSPVKDAYSAPGRNGQISLRYDF